MNLSLKRFELILWMLAPASISFLLFVICMIPKHIWGISYIVPLFTLYPVFYWGRTQGAEMPYWFAFIIGILTDVISASPLGLSALLYLIFLAVLHAQSKYIKKEGFIVIWGYFMLMLAVIIIVQWLIMSLLAGKSYALVPAITQWLLSASIYPLFHRMFDGLSEHIKHRRWIISHG